MESTRHDTEEPSPKKKFSKILRRITEVETYFTDLKMVLRSYASKGSIKKEKYEELTKCLTNYEKLEESNTTTKLAMKLAADLMVKVGNEQMTAIQRLEKSVVPNFSSYAKLSKCLKKDVNKAIAAYEKAEDKRKLVKTFSEKLTARKHRDVLKDAQRELENAEVESRRLGLLSQDQVTKFEQKRLTDLKEGMKSFFRAEIAKHAKSLELLTEAYKSIHSIDEHGDLRAIQREFKLKEIAASCKKTGTGRGNTGDLKKAQRKVDAHIEELAETSADETNISTSEASTVLSSLPKQSRNVNQRRK